MSAGDKPVVIVGAERFARRMYVYLTADARRQVVGFAVHQRHLRERELLGLPVVAVEELPGRFPPAEHAACVAVGYVRLGRQSLHRARGPLGARRPLTARD